MEMMDDQTGDQRKVWESLWVENSPEKKTKEVNDLKKTGRKERSLSHEAREEQPQQQAQQKEVVLLVEGDNVEFDGEIYDFVPPEEDEGESGQVQDPVERSRSSSSSSSLTSSSSLLCSCSASKEDDPKKKVLPKKEAKSEIHSPSESELSLEWEAGKLRSKTKRRLIKKRPALVFSDEESSSASASSSTSSTASTRLDRRKRSLRSSQALVQKKKLRASLSKIHSKLKFEDLEAHLEG